MSTFRAMFFSGDTGGGVMDGNRGAGPGFDWARIGLSGFLVVCSALGIRNLKVFPSFSMQDWRSSGRASSRRGRDVESIIFLRKIKMLRCSSAKIE